jgi:hypothetical protein
MGDPMPDRSFTAVRRHRGSIVATGVAHDDGTVTVTVSTFDQLSAPSIDVAHTLLDGLSTEPVDIVWD